MKKIRKIFVLLLFGIHLAPCFSYGQVTSGQEYNLKAAFLYRFLDYIEWTSAPAPPSEISIAIVGQSEIFNPLNQIVRNLKSPNRKIVLKQYLNASDINSCDIAFISKRYPYSVESALSRLSSRSSLVISESEDDFAKGSHINFMVTDNKLKFSVNLKTTTSAGIKISSQLLQHAATIKR